MFSSLESSFLVLRNKTAFKNSFQTCFWLSFLVEVVSIHILLKSLKVSFLLYEPKSKQFRAFKARKALLDC